MYGYMKSSANRKRNIRSDSMKIAPSILSADFSRLKEEIDTIKEADWIHIDVMDGHFVPNLTIGPAVVKAIRPHSDLVFDTHLMISDPGRYLDYFIDAGSDHITFHIETVDNVDALIDKLHAAGVKAGLSLKPATPVSDLKPYLDKVDLVLVMSVEPGFGGQSFMRDTVAKMEELDRLRSENGYGYEIVVDGGINESTAAICESAGVDVVVAGSYVFKSADRAKQIRRLRR